MKKEKIKEISEDTQGAIMGLVLILVIIVELMIGFSIIPTTFIQKIDEYNKEYTITSIEYVTHAKDKKNSTSTSTALKKNEYYLVSCISPNGEVIDLVTDQIYVTDTLNDKITFNIFKYQEIYDYLFKEDKLFDPYTEDITQTIKRNDYKIEISKETYEKLLNNKKSG